MPLYVNVDPFAEYVSPLLGLFGKFSCHYLVSVLSIYEITSTPECQDGLGYLILQDQQYQFSRHRYRGGKCNLTDLP